MRFYGHFAAAYGTIWLVLLVVSLVTQTQLETGALGMFGFPIVALLYALGRRAGEDSAEELMGLRLRIARLERQVADVRRTSGADAAER